MLLLELKTPSELESNLQWIDIIATIISIPLLILPLWHVYSSQFCNLKLSIQCSTNSVQYHLVAIYLMLSAMAAAVVSWHMQCTCTIHNACAQKYKIMTATVQCSTMQSSTSYWGLTSIFPLIFQIDNSCLQVRNTDCDRQFATDQNFNSVSGLNIFIWILSGETTRYRPSQSPGLVRIWIGPESVVKWKRSPPDLWIFGCVALSRARQIK